MINLRYACYLDANLPVYSDSRSLDDESFTATSHNDSTKQMKSPGQNDVENCEQNCLLRS